eukprot:XP_002511783.2 vacuolar iron transporter homolog 2.1 [Ricinus communis]
MADEITEEENNIITRLLRQEEDEKKDEGKPKEPWKGGEFVKSMVYAGLDAIVTCFSLISSISASQRSSVDVLVLGFANLVADGISMGLGDFISSSTEKDTAAKGRAVTEWEVANRSRPLQLALLRKYQSLGMEINDASTVVEIFSKYKDILVDEKMAAHVGTLPTTPAEKPWKNALVTFLAFLVFGSLPLLSFIVLIPFTNSDQVKFTGACALAAAALVLLGISKGKIAGQSYVPSVVITLTNGAIAATAAYSLGWTLRNVAHLEDTGNAGS